MLAKFDRLGPVYSRVSRLGARATRTKPSERSSQRQLSHRRHRQPKKIQTSYRLSMSPWPPRSPAAGRERATARRQHANPPPEMARVDCNTGTAVTCACVAIVWCVLLVCVWIKVWWRCAGATQQWNNAHHTHGPGGVLDARALDF